MPQFITIALLCINIIVAALLIGAVLLQKSEGGALGMGGGGSSNFMSARGTGDLLTRITWILFGLFLTISITLTLIAAASRPQAAGSNIKVDPNAPIPKSSTLPTGDPSNFNPAIGAAPAPVTPTGNPILSTDTPAPITAPSEKK